MMDRQLKFLTLTVSEKLLRRDCVLLILPLHQPAGLQQRRQRIHQLRRVLQRTRLLVSMLSSWQASDLCLAGTILITLVIQNHLVSCSCCNYSAVLVTR